MVHLLILINFGLFLWWLWKDTQRPKGYPPGPRLWPIVGNLLQMAWLGRGRNKYLALEDLAGEYGDVVGLRILNEMVVVVSGKEAVKEVTSRDDFSGRPDGFVFLYRNYGKKLGIGFNDGHTWAVQRRFTFKNLRNFGLGRPKMEMIIMDEISHLIVSIKNHGSSKPLEVNQIFTVPIMNVVWDILTGKRYSKDDEKIQEIITVTKKMFSVQGSGRSVFLGQFPWIRHIFPELSGFNALHEHLIKVKKFLNDILDEHVMTLNASAPRNVIDAYLLEMNNYDDQNGPFSRDHLLTICDDLFEASTDTTSNSLSFFVLYMLRYPEVQKKIQREIDTILGRERIPILEDRLNMPYTEATIMETSRLSPVLPLLLPHRTMTTTKLHNYTIEKGTTILISAYSLHVDPYWKDPLVFRPERFIGDNGKVKQDEHLLPFGMGKRRCIGETLAKSTLFLTVVSLLQQFDMKIPENEPLPPIESVDGITLNPKPYRAVFKLRE